MKVVVIGINHAGTSVVRSLLSLDPNLEVIALDRNSNISFLGCGIALTVGGVVKNPKDLFYSNPEELENLGAQIHMNSEVIEIDRAKKEVHIKDLTSGKVWIQAYDKLVYAAGSWPVNLHFKNQDLQNIRLCKTYQHALELIAQAKDTNVRKVTVIGAGYIGIELVEAYCEAGKEVTLVDTLTRPLGNYFDPEFSQHLSEKLDEKGIKTQFGAKVQEFLGEDGKVTHVVTDKGTFAADLVIMCIGCKPNTALLDGLKKIRNGALVINRKAQTSDPDIYAVGDCAALYEASSKSYRNIALATNAVKTGLVAASQICGLKDIVIPNIVGTNAMCVFGLKYAATGLSETAAPFFGLKVQSCIYDDNDRPEWMNEYYRVKVKIVFEEESKRIVGTQILSFGKANHTEWVFALALAIQLGLTLYQVAFIDVYFLPHLNKPFNFVLSAILKTLGMLYVSH